MACPTGMQTPASQTWVRAPHSESWSVLPAGQLCYDTVPSSSGITIKSMRLLFKRLHSKQLAHTLGEQGMWACWRAARAFCREWACVPGRRSGSQAPGSGASEASLPGRSGLWLLASLVGDCQVDPYPGLWDGGRLQGKRGFYSKSSCSRAGNERSGVGQGLAEATQEFRAGPGLTVTSWVLVTPERPF